MTTINLSYASDQQQLLINGMKNLGERWQEILSQSEKFVSRCQSGGYRVTRAKPGTRLVGVDLQKTASLMNPYIGIIEIRGEFQGHYDCFGSIDEIPSEIEWAGNDMDYRFRINYVFDSGYLVMNGGNQQFVNNFTKRGAPLNSENWKSILKCPIN
jgi:hypothetical protein